MLLLYSSTFTSFWISMYTQTLVQRHLIVCMQISFVCWFFHGVMDFSIFKCTCCHFHGIANTLCSICMPVSRLRLTLKNRLHMQVVLKKMGAVFLHSGWFFPQRAALRSCLVLLHLCGVAYKALSSPVSNSPCHTTWLSRSLWQRAWWEKVRVWKKQRGITLKPRGMANNFVLRLMGLRFTHAMWNLLSFLLFPPHMHVFSLCRKWLRVCVQPDPSSISPSVQPLCPLCAFDNQQVLWSDVTCCLLCYTWFCSNHAGACGQCGLSRKPRVGSCVFLDFGAKMQELWLARRSSHETGEVSLRDW